MGLDIEQAQAIAAEMSTGALVMLLTLNTGKKCSMLVTNMQATFFKKASQHIHFTCNAGSLITNAIDESMRTNEPVKIILESIGKLPTGEVTSTFIFEWSVKFKKD